MSNRIDYALEWLKEQTDAGTVDSAFYAETAVLAMRDISRLIEMRADYDRKGAIALLIDKLIVELCAVGVGSDAS